MIQIDGLLAVVGKRVNSEHFADNVSTSVSVAVGSGLNNTPFGAGLDLLIS